MAQLHNHRPIKQGSRTKGRFNASGLYWIGPTPQEQATRLEQAISLQLSFLCTETTLVLKSTHKWQNDTYTAEPTMAAVATAKGQGKFTFDYGYNVEYGYALETTNGSYPLGKYAYLEETLNNYVLPKMYTMFDNALVSICR